MSALETCSFGADSAVTVVACSAPSPGPPASQALVYADSLAAVF